MRQGLITDYDPKRGACVATLAYECESGFQVKEHAHGSDQVIYATRGVMEIASGQSLWVIPPHFAVWIRARTLHRIRMPGPVSMRTLYLRPGIAPRLPQACTVLYVAPLLRELIVEAVRIGELRSRNRVERSLADLLVYNLEAASPLPTSLTLPKDSRAVAVAAAAMARQSEYLSLESLCASAGVGVRTVQRLFRREVGTDFETWRRQVRLTKAVELLVGGRSVKEVAFDIGYSHPSAFVEMFRRTFGATPKAWVLSLEPRLKQ